MEVATSSPSSSTVLTTTTSTMAIDRSFCGGDAEYPVWEKIGAIVRLSYGIGIYGAMALAGKLICSITRVDSMGGFDLSQKAIVDGLGYAAPSIMALLFIIDDEVVKYSPHARSIRDVEDEELRSFFYGMSPWQFILIVTASLIGEELFYRATLQEGALRAEGNGIGDINLLKSSLVVSARVCSGGSRTDNFFVIVVGVVVLVAVGRGMLGPVICLPN